MCCHSKLAVNNPDQHQQCHSDAFLVNFEQTDLRYRDFQFQIH